MVKQIENVDWLGECTIFKHDQFFDYMGHGSEWSKEHKNSNSDKNHVWYFIKKSQYTLLKFITYPWFNPQTPDMGAMEVMPEFRQAWNRN